MELDLGRGLAGAHSLVRPEVRGYPPDYWPDVFLPSRASTIYSGTSEIQRNVMGERAVALPKESAVV